MKRATSFVLATAMGAISIVGLTGLPAEARTMTVVQTSASQQDSYARATAQIRTVSEGDDGAIEFGGTCAQLSGKNARVTSIELWTVDASGNDQERIRKRYNWNLLNPFSYNNYSQTEPEEQFSTKNIKEGSSLEEGVRVRAVVNCRAAYEVPKEWGFFKWDDTQYHYISAASAPYLVKTVTTQSSNQSTVDAGADFDADGDNG